MVLTGENSLGPMSDLLHAVDEAKPKIEECFKETNSTIGVPYDDYPTFQKVMKSLSGPAHEVIDEVFVPLVPGLHEKLTEGITVLDLGCGSGVAVTRLAECYPNSQFFGFDIYEPGIEAGNKEAQAKGLTNLKFEAHDAAELKDNSHQSDTLDSDAKTYAQLEDNSNCPRRLILKNSGLVGRV